MKCPNCAKEIPDGAAFCKYCGAPAARSPEAAPAARPAPRPVPPPAPKQPRKKPKKKRVGLIVALCILGSLLVAGGAVFLLAREGIIDVSGILPFTQREDAGLDEDDEDDGDKDKSKSKDKDKDEDKDKDKDEDRDDDKDGDKDDDRNEDGDDAPGEEAFRPLNSFLYADVAVCVADQMRLWPDTGARPFEGAAERISGHTERSLLVVTVDDAGEDIAAFTDGYVQEYRRSNADAGSLLDELVAITFDASRRSCYMARYTDSAHDYDLDGLAGRVEACVAGSDYETAVIYLLENAEEREEPSEYLLPNSAAEYLSREDLRGLSWEECCFARNEIYARHGRIFATPEIRAYFESKTWYTGTIPGADFDANVGNYLSDIERKNADLILEYEKDTWGGSYY